MINATNALKTKATIPSGNDRAQVVSGRETARPNANQSRSTPNVVSIGIATKTKAAALGALGEVLGAVLRKYNTTTMTAVRRQQTVQ
jgi:hypothetical protein